MCGKWREVRIVYNPGVSGPEASDVWVFTSVDKFQNPTKLKKNGPMSKFGRTHLVTLIMAPAGVLSYIFQVGSDLTVSRTAPTIHDISPMVQIRRVQVAGDDVDDIVDESDDFVEISSLNSKTVLERGPNEPVCWELVPRRPGEFLYDNLTEQEWSLESSLFAPFDDKLGRGIFSGKCFEVDWKVSCTTHLLREDSDRSQVRDVIRRCYADIKVLHGSLCSLDRGAPDGAPMAYGIGLYEYTHFLAQHNLVGEDMSVETADAQFFIAATPPRDIHVDWDPTAQRGGRVILRHSFIELLVRIAASMYARAVLAPVGSKESRMRTKAKSIGHALEILWNKNIMHPFPPTTNNFNCAKWRTDVMHQPIVEEVYRKHMKGVVDPLFAAYSIEEDFKNCGEASKTSMRPEDWFALLDNLNVLARHGEDEDSLLNTWDRVWIWQNSAMSHVDELTTSEHLLLTFVEFLEAIARLVGLLRSRTAVDQATAEEREQWGYGMDRCSAATIFCVDEDTMDAHKFAVHLDQFLGSAVVSAALANSAR